MNIINNIKDFFNYKNDKNLVDLNKNNNEIKISGSIGMVKLVGEKNNVYVFYDDHSNTSYCKDNNSVFLYDTFDNIINQNSEYIILLEEPFVNNYSDIKFLWNDIPHVVKFRNFYKKIIKNCSDTKVCKVFPVDIRLIISDISIDQLVLNIDSDEYFNDYNISVFEYFRYILYLFDYIEWDNMLIKDADNNLKFVKKVFSYYYKDKYYINLKEQFDKFYNIFIKPNFNIKIRIFLKEHKYVFNDMNVGYPFENNIENDFFLQYDKLLNGIMEFYTYILLSGTNKKNVIIYCGYYHSNNLVYILKKYYNYKNEYTIGNTEDIEKIDEDKIKSCLFINKKIFE